MDKSWTEKQDLSTVRPLLCQKHVLFFMLLKQHQPINMVLQFIRIASTLYPQSMGLNIDGHGNA
ncbi:hypothetical protein LINPERHAP1_LOCUS4948 [Linum perenne]